VSFLRKQLRPLKRALGSVLLDRPSVREGILKLCSWREGTEIVRTETTTPSLQLTQIQDTEGSIPDILHWSTSFDIHTKPWLVLGKGPSYAHIKDINLDDYYTCSLNHVVREHPVDLAHIIDIDVVEDCKGAIDKNARFLVLPFHPHVNHDPTKKTVYDFVAAMPVLQSLQKQDRLVWYNLSSSKRRVESSPVIVAKFFSAEAAVNILASCGVKTIRSLGVDGGNTYAAAYEDLKSKTLLANTQPTFDLQFKQIANTIRKRKIFYAPLHKEAPIRIFVGTDKTQMLAARVLEYSIKKHASMSVDFVPMVDMPVPMPKDPAHQPRTGFSFARFLIPSLCGYQGRAIYLDADMLVLADISKVWEFPMNSADILCAEQPTEKGRVRQYSVMLMNCANLSWNINEIVNGLNEGKYNYTQLMYEFCIVSSERISPTLPYEWNCLEHFEPEKTCLIHYTDMPTQPWVSLRNRNRAVWYQTLKEAVIEGFVKKEEIYREVELGHVSPDLPQKIGFPRHINHRRLAKSFVPPYKRFQRPNIPAKSQ
jgi:hypothetical protein